MSPEDENYWLDIYEQVAEQNRDERREHRDAREAYQDDAPSWRDAY